MMKPLMLAGVMLFASLPSTSNYQLNSYGFGAGGSAGSSTSTYALEGISGELGAGTLGTSAYSVKPGFVATQQAHVPKIASFSNGGSYYNKLHFVLDQQSNPSDALYALQISTTSDFSSDINYVKGDLTIGASLNLTDYQTYATWGGASGSDIIGLQPNTTYYLRAKATQSKFTESGYGPSASAATVNPSLSFSLSPSSVNFSNLLLNTVVDAPSSISLSFASNANSGGNVYISGLHGGLFSAKASHTIVSASGDLSSLSNGFGAQITAASQTSGGPFAAVSPYNGSSNNIGLIDINTRKLLGTPAPVTGGSGSVLLKAKSAINDPAQNDYTETITMLASANF